MNDIAISVISSFVCVAPAALSHVRLVAKRHVRPVQLRMIERPQCLTPRPNWRGLDLASGPNDQTSGEEIDETDALSDVLRTVRLTGAIFFDVAAKAPWVAEQLPREMILPKILPGADHLIAYHVVTEGRCFANIVGGEPIAVDAGEVIVFTNGDPHVMSSSPGMRADPVSPDMLDVCHRRPIAVLRQLWRRRTGWPNSYADSWRAMPDRSIRCSITCRLSSRSVGGQGSDARWLGQFIHVSTM